jgi:ComF family protein
MDLLYPPVCGGCNRKGCRWCSNCQKQVKEVPEPVCRICGQPQSHPGVCTRCNAQTPWFTMLRSWAVFEGTIRNTLHSLKYHHNVGLGSALAKPMAKYVNMLGWKVDLIVPVPLGKKRLAERGYNQAGLLAMPMALYQRRHYVPQALGRVRETRSQVGLSIAERKENMAGAFKAESGLVSGLNILVMDDVTTTGATISACAESLIKAGAKSVYALTLARAMVHYGLDIV